MYLCGPGKHNCQPFCGPEGRFYCSDSVCSLWPAPFSCLCVSMMILCVCWKLSAAEQVKTDCCHTPAVVSTLLTPLPVSYPVDDATPLHILQAPVNTFKIETTYIITVLFTNKSIPQCAVSYWIIYKTLAQNSLCTPKIRVAFHIICCTVGALMQFVKIQQDCKTDFNLKCEH